jgi:hypothetical protein
VTLGSGAYEANGREAGWLGAGRWEDADGRDEEPARGWEFDGCTAICRTPLPITSNRSMFPFIRAMLISSVLGHIVKEPIVYWEGEQYDLSWSNLFLRLAKSSPADRDAHAFRIPLRATNIPSCPCLTSSNNFLPSLSH